jgi:hypothetical protein
LLIGENVVLDKIQVFDEKLGFEKEKKKKTCF